MQPDAVSAIVMIVIGFGLVGYLTWLIRQFP